MEPPLVEPAPTMVWISSMNRMAPGTLPRSVMTPFSRCSKSPRYLVPASSAPMSRAKMRTSRNSPGTSPRATRRASPSAMAVLPTPGSPTYSGLFLRRRASTWMVRSSSLARPMSGSMRPSRARAVRSTVNFSSASMRGESDAPSSPSASPEPSPSPPSGMPCEMCCNTSSRVTPCDFRK